MCRLGRFQAEALPGLSYCGFSVMLESGATLLSFMGLTAVSSPRELVDLLLNGWLEIPNLHCFCAAVRAGVEATSFSLRLLCWTSQWPGMLASGSEVKGCVLSQIPFLVPTAVTFSQWWIVHFTKFQESPLWELPASDGLTLAKSGTVPGAGATIQKSCL